MVRLLFELWCVPAKVCRMFVDLISLSWLMVSSIVQWNAKWLFKKIIITCVVYKCYESAQKEIVGSCVCCMFLQPENVCIVCWIDLFERTFKLFYCKIYLYCFCYMNVTMFILNCVYFCLSPCWRKEILFETVFSLLSILQIYHSFGWWC